MIKTSNLIALCCVVMFSCALALGQEKIQPLKPPDRSSPRATMKTFLESADKVSDYVLHEYRPRQSRAGSEHLFSLALPVIECLDLSDLPPVSRTKAGAAAALALYETLCKIDLPPMEEIPGTAELKSLGEPPRWVAPNTEIALIRLTSGPHAGDFVFSTHTVAMAEDYHQRTHALPYVRTVPIADVYELAVRGGGWMIPFGLVDAMPDWLRQSLGGISLWKWLALCILLILYSAGLRVAHRVSRRIGDDRPFLQSFLRLALPVYVLLATPLAAYFALGQINLRGEVGVVTQLIATAMMYVSAAWLSWRVADVLAEAIISSPHIKRQSIDAHLIRIFTRLLGISVALTLLVVGADKVGVPVYGVIAGLGVGGLAIALAAQPSIENLIGGLNIFADRPIRVGHLCKYGTDIGTVEEIGIRSTRIRNVDRTLATVPNGMLSKMSIVNMTEREQMLIRTVLTLPGDARERVSYVLAKVREMLLEHPKVQPKTARARLTGFTVNSAEIEVIAYVATRDMEEFLCVQEAILMRAMEIVEQSKSPDAIGAWKKAAAP